ncbi:MAG: hypothetical protein RIQ92_713, partial [Actinomycetota bacterium]
INEILTANIELALTGKAAVNAVGSLKESTR